MWTYKWKYSSWREDENGVEYRLCIGTMYFDGHIKDGYAYKQFRDGSSVLVAQRVASWEGVD